MIAPGMAPDDAGDDTATVTIYDRKGRTLHTRVFVGGDELAHYSARNYVDSITDIIKPVIPMAPGFSILSAGILRVGQFEKIEYKTPIVGMVTGQLNTRYVDILGNRHPARGHFAILNEATGEVFMAGWADNDEDTTFESVEKWLEYMAAQIRKLRAEMGIGEAERVVHTEGNERERLTRQIGSIPQIH